MVEYAKYICEQILRSRTKYQRGNSLESASRKGGGQIYWRAIQGGRFCFADVLRTEVTPKVLDSTTNSPVVIDFPWVMVFFRILQGLIPLNMFFLGYGLMEEWSF